MLLNGLLPIEMELTLSGSFQPEEPQTRDYPGCAAHMEDMTIQGVSVLVYMLKDGKRQWVPHDVMGGVNMNSPDIQRLLENILGIPDVWERANDELTAGA